ncbi:hypothetical protein CEXT_367961 [Caerostris extrusa]|uniref:Uncharacterized protein n=1 Tax=Caerostris extrusa TaxID=172846 RepID=A0AAV4R0D7_CAEEX|nr:hypothetical protein CEXT_367961 [Caerostris extrusa]
MKICGGEMRKLPDEIPDEQHDWNLQTHLRDDTVMHAKGRATTCKVILIHARLSIKYNVKTYLSCKISVVTNFREEDILRGYRLITWAMRGSHSNAMWPCQENCAVRAKKDVMTSSSAHLNTTPSDRCLVVASRPSLIYNDCIL